MIDGVLEINDQNRCTLSGPPCIEDSRCRASENFDIICCIFATLFKQASHATRLQEDLARTQTKCMISQRLPAAHLWHTRFAPTSNHPGRRQGVWLGMATFFAAKPERVATSPEIVAPRGGGGGGAAPARTYNTIKARISHLQIRFLFSLQL